MDDGRDRLAVAHDRRRRLTPSRSGSTGEPARVDVATGARQPVGDGEAVVAEGTGERRAERSGRRRRAELVGEPGDRALGALDPPHAPRHADRRRRGEVRRGQRTRHGTRHRWGPRPGRAAASTAYEVIDNAAAPAGTTTNQIDRRATGVARAIRHTPAAAASTPMTAAARSQEPVEQARQVQLGADEEHVVGAVGPAVQVEERITNQRQPDTDRNGGAIRHDDEHPGQPALDSPRRVREHEVGDERQQQRRHDQRHAAGSRRPLVPADPVRGQPRHTDRRGERRD